MKNLLNWLLYVAVILVVACSPSKKEKSAVDPNAKPTIEVLANSPEESTESEDRSAPTLASSDLYLDIPFYFAIPKHSQIKKALPSLKDALMFTEKVNGLEDQDIELKMIVYKDKKRNQANYRGLRLQELFKKGVLQTGDIVLSFRKHWARTIPYSHMQLGVSHSGLIFEEKGKAYNLDMPLDQEYNGLNVTSELNSKHYVDATELHIIRPRLSKKQKTNINKWVKHLKKNYNRFRNQDNLMKFNTDYLSPLNAKYGTKFISSVGKILLGAYKSKNAKSMYKLQMYCSEFIYAMLALSNCNPDRTQRKFKRIAFLQDEVSCAKPFFTPVQSAQANKNSEYGYSFSGLIFGPEMILDEISLKNKKAEQQLKLKLAKSVFASRGAQGLSSGHRQVNADPRIQMLTRAAKKIYLTVNETLYPPSNMSRPSGVSQDDFVFGFRKSSREKLVEQMDTNPKVQQLLMAVQENYSPAAYLINAYLPRRHAQRKFDYVATLSYASEKGYKKAERLTKDQGH